MDWRDEGIVLAARRHGENDAILTVLTLAHGRHLGLVKGGMGRRNRPLLEIGNSLALHWRARLAEQLGNFQIESAGHAPGTGADNAAGAGIAGAPAAAMLDRPLALAALTSACALVDVTLPERAPHPDIHASLLALLSAIADNVPDWTFAYARWEMGLLGALGFGLDLARCALTGAVEGLAYVSPKTGRAVTREAGAPYRDRLLPLPAFLTMPSGGQATPAALHEALRLTGFFLENHALHLHGASGGAHARASGLPAARARFMERLAAARAVTDGKSADCG